MRNTLIRCNNDGHLLSMHDSIWAGKKNVELLAARVRVLTGFYWHALIMLVYLMSKIYKLKIEANRHFSFWLG